MLKKLFTMGLIIIFLVQNVLPLQNIVSAENSDNSSPAKSSALSETSDTTMLSAPIDLSYEIQKNNTIKLSWSVINDGKNAVGFEIYRDGKKIGTTSDHCYEDHLNDTNQKIEYYVKAFDIDGNVSKDSNHIIVTYELDTNTANSTLNLTYEVTGSAITLTWSEATDNVNTAEYEVYRDGVKIGTVSGLSYIVKMDDNDKLHDYYVKAINKGGNVLQESNHVKITNKPDTIPPNPPTNLAYVVSGSAIILTWSAATDNVKVVGYEVYRDGTKIGYTEETSYVDSDITSEETYSYEIVAVDSAGNKSSKSEALSVTVDELTSDNELSTPYDYKTNRFIIKYKNKTGSAKLKKDLKSSVLKSHKINNKRNEDIEVLLIKKRVRPNEFIKKVREIKNNKDAAFDFDQDIEYIQPDYQLNTSSADPYYNEQWGIINSKTNNLTEDTEKIQAVTNDTINTYKIDVNVVQAWDKTKGEGAVIAVLDTGIDITQEDLAPNIWTNSKEIPDNHIDDDGNGYIDDWNGWNFVDETNTIHSPNNINDEWHGTHIAGIIAAQNDNNKGITGVAPDARILPLKVFDHGSAYTSDIISAIEYAEKMGVKIVNCSWGSTDSNTALKEAIDNSSMLFVCAAGNDHTDIDMLPLYPASYDSNNIISVASINSIGELSSFSNYGENSVDIAAPGEDIISTSPDNKYITSSGTSMAAAFISGEAALLLSMNMQLYATSIKEQILATADRLSTLNGKILNGNKVNYTKAVQNDKSNQLIMLKDTDNNDLATNNFVSINNISTDNVTQKNNQLLSSAAWRSIINLPIAVSGIRAVTVDGKLFAISGWKSKAVYEYSESTNAWVQRANMITERSGSCVAVVNGKIYAIGGYDSSNNKLSSVEEYDPSANTWTLKANMPTAREGASYAVVKDIIYVMGGYNGNALNIVEAYNPSTNTWSTKTSMAMARRSAGASVINGKIYVAGGYGVSSLEVYDPETNSWTLKASMSMPRGDAGVAAVNGKLYAIAGYGTSSIVNSTEEYSPSTNTWTTSTSMPNAKRSFGIAVEDNTIYTIGGNNGSMDVNTVETYTLEGVSAQNIEYVYDANSRLIKIMSNNIVIVTFTYDKNGNLLTTTTVSQ